MAMIDNAATTIKPRTVKAVMFTVTEPWAVALFDWSNVLLAFGAAAVLIGTIGAFAMGAAKEQFSNERISANETATERAKADAEKARDDAAQANARAAEANRQAAEAELTLAKYRAGRSLAEDQKTIMGEILKSAPKGPVIIKPNFLSPEPTRFANQLGEVFNRAGFSGVGDKPLSIVSTNLPGIFVVVRDRDDLPPQFAAIATAFQAAQIPFSANAEPYVPDAKTVVILVGERP